MKKTNSKINGNEYYRIRKVVGHKADGSPIIKSFYGSGIKEAEEKAQEYMNKLNNGYSNDFDKVTVIELLKTWLFNIKLIAVKPSTFVTYESNYRLYIAPSPIANMKVSSVKKIHIQTFYNELFEKHSTEKVKAVHKLLHSFFEYAVDEGYLVKNPCHKVIIPKNRLEKSQNQKLDIFSLDELNYIKERFKGNKYEPIVYTAIYTGMREGEILALKWKNVNLEQGYIHVEESLKSVKVFDKNGNGEMKTLILDPKTKNSIRDIFIPDILINKLKEIPRTSEYVFTNNGQPITHKSLYFQWSHLLKDDKNITYRKFHALRHTYASVLLANGADLKSVQDLMGHYDIRITQTYLHSIPENKKRIVSIFDTI